MEQEQTFAMVETEEAMPPVPAGDDFDDGLSALSNDDIIIPRLVVAQDKTDCADEHKGKLYCDVTGDSYDEMEMVVLRMTKSRVCFPETFNKEDGPICRSHDAVVPADDIDGEEPMADNCAECEYSKWGKDKKGRRVAPRCKEVWNLLVVNMETYTPMWFSLKSTALAPARKILSALKIQSQAKRVPACCFKFTATTDIRNGDSGDSYIPRFHGIRMLDRFEAENMLAIRDSLANERFTDADTDTDTSTDNDADNDADDF